MLRKILFISLALLLSSSVVMFDLSSNPVLAAPATVDRKTRDQILASTVCITMYAPLTDEQGNPQYVRMDGQTAIQLTVGEGLGTLARQGDDVLIVTHDHWPLLTPDLRRVEFHDVGHELLLEMSGEQFLRLVLFRDGGTMILMAPDKLVGPTVPVPLGSSASVRKNAIVTIAHRRSHDGQIGVALMQVQKGLNYKGQPAYRMTSLNGEVVIEGNSGAGVLFDGQLIGNMWGTILAEEKSRITGEGAGFPQQTSFSLAAQLPAAIAAQ